MTGADLVFDLCGELPTGTTVLEASAGTGKTFTIAALATRYVAEAGIDLSELLLVTFGRAATSELRDRVRERLVSAERALRDLDPRSSADPLIAHLAGVDAVELGRRRGRLARAVAQFDAATIATTHGFCQQMLAGLGVAADADPDAVLLPDLDDLVDEVVDDLYLARYAGSGSPALAVEEARRVARAAVGDPQARLAPADAPAGSTAAERFGFAADVAREVGRRKRARRLLDYDDLLTGLQEALTHPVHGAAAAARIRARYRAVLVDEFQDTDPVQWQILRTAFHGHRTLVLIGDPKQAVYAFRGGDVVAYLAAREAATRTATLQRNWRSDAALLAGLDEVIGGTALGDPRIMVAPVQAEHAGRRHDGAAPVRLRQLTRRALGVSARSTSPVARVREAIAVDVAADVVRQLRTHRLLDSHGWRAVQPADIAVLTRRNSDAALVRRALVEAGVPAVVSGLSSVFDSAAARAWVTLLTALERPGHAGRTTTAALGPFVGWDAARLAGATDADRDDLSDRIRAWSRVLRRQGVAAVFEAAVAAGLAERLLRTGTGERTLTDLRHVAQSLHLTAVADGLGPAALTDWLRRRVAEAGEDYAEERSRRLETDAAAVQVVTVHASKGLEFPIVYLPFGWDRFESSEPELLRYHDGDGSRTLHVGGLHSPGYAGLRDRHLAEERGEDLRLLYVALTRAASHVVLWWAPSRNSAAGPLSRLLLGPANAGPEPAARVAVPRDDEAAARFGRLAAGSGGTVVVEQVDAVEPTTRWTPPATAAPPLAVARLARELDATWGRTSYTGLTAAAHASRYAAERYAGERVAGVVTEPETAGVQDEPDGTGEPDVGTPDGTELRMADLPAGAAFGTLVHSVLERVDTGVADLPAEVLARCQEAGAGRFAGVDADRLAAALTAVLDTPLGPAAGGLALRDVRPADRLSELDFELPLAGGDTPLGPGATVGGFADLLRRHLPTDDPFRAYADRLSTAEFAGARLRGYLTGSLDAVLRLPDTSAGGSAGGSARGPSAEPRYLVVDYKTNRLAAPFEPLTPWHYRPAALVEAMIEADYPLQLLLYLVALHRFLCWRQPGYDPDRQLAGGLYLFVRGMSGPRTETFDGAPAGVLAWRPPAELVVALSELIAGGTP